jgi:hypothetical protein
MLKPTLTWDMCVNNGIGEDYKPNNPVTFVVHLLYRTLLQATYLVEEGLVLSKPDVYIHNPDRLSSRLSCRLGRLGRVLGEEIGVVVELFPDL